MEEERWRLGSTPPALNVFFAKRRGSECHLTQGHRALPTYKPHNPALSTSLPSRASLTQRKWSMGSSRELLPEPVRVSNAYVGVFRHAPCTRGFKDMLWEPSFSTARPTLTQMDLARQMRYKARHVDQSELRKLPCKQFKDCTRWKGQAGVEEEDEDEDPVTPPNCVICIDGFTPWDEVRELPTCGHVFHRRCIDLWLRGVCSFEACFTRSCPVCKTALDLPSDCGEDDEEEEEEELELEGVGGAAARRLKVEEDEEEQQQCGKARRAQQPGAGLMSRLYDVIPGWAFAQVGSALMFQDAVAAAQQDCDSGRPQQRRGGSGGGRPPCDESWARQ